MDTMPATGWSLATALRPGLALISSFTYALYTLASPGRHTPRNFTTVALLAAIFFHQSNHLTPDSQLNTISAHAVLLWLLHLTHILFIRRNDDLPSPLPSFIRAYKTIFNPRGINTPWSTVSTTPPLTKPNPSPTTQTQPSPRTAFLFAQSLIILTRYLSLSFLHSIFNVLLTPSSLFTNTNTATSLSLPWRTRTHLTLTFFIHNYLLLSSLHEIFSLIFVCLLRLDEPHEWPPLYGSIESAYTIRRFWREFWHRGGYAALKGTSHVITEWALGAGGEKDQKEEKGRGSEKEKGKTRAEKKGKTWEEKKDKARVKGQRESKQEEGSKLSLRRAVEIAVAFAISGLIQVAVDWKGGRCNVWGSGVFYLLQSVGVVLEEAAMRVWNKARRRVEEMFGRDLGQLERKVGYLGRLLEENLVKLNGAEENAIGTWSSLAKHVTTSLSFMIPGWDIRTCLYVYHWICVGIQAQTSLEIPWATTANHTESLPAYATPTPEVLPTYDYDEPFVPSPTQGPLPTDCVDWYQVQPNDTCEMLLSHATEEQFMAWHPFLNGDCNGLWAGDYYCTWAGSTLPDPPTVTYLAIGEPVQPWTAINCNRWFYAVQVTCQNIVDMFGRFSLNDFIGWNPAVGTACDKLKDDTTTASV
ncbi:hypothetical protein QBC34DRAFT_457307 [Podospora aff. communis PSN243]|uniref:Wax synthase domain-containing protein n=1 Tax=Podospora aff. communis PSN243 TaxID=3040156 RepID=A0AAV9GVC0_9PEZI|nr:hypothetical protein QBC34DRAFT_457307 [Podospora aff. communis PSN243]